VVLEPFFEPLSCGVLEAVLTLVIDWCVIRFDVSVWSIKPAGVNPNVTLFGQQNYF